MEVMRSALGPVIDIRYHRSMPNGCTVATQRGIRLTMAEWTGLKDIIEKKTVENLFARLGKAYHMSETGRMIRGMTNFGMGHLVGDDYSNPYRLEPEPTPKDQGFVNWAGSDDDDDNPYNRSYF